MDPIATLLARQAERETAGSKSKLAEQLERDALERANEGCEQAALAATSDSHLGQLAVLVQAVRAELKPISSNTERDRVKAERYRADLLASFETVLANPGQVSPDVSTLAVWLADVGALDEALALTDFCLAHDCPMDDSFKRALDAVIADKLLRWAQAQLTDDASPEPYLSLLYLAIAEGKYRVHDETRLAVTKALADSFNRAGDAIRALAHYLEVQALAGGNGGVKGKIEQLQKKLAAQAEAEMAGDAS